MQRTTVVKINTAPNFQLDENTIRSKSDPCPFISFLFTNLGARFSFLDCVPRLIICTPRVWFIPIFLAGLVF
jgi:hypothetical protein